LSVRPEKSRANPILAFKANPSLPLPCGQCLHCRINKRRVWTTRLLLELTQHPYASWLTLTYSDEYLPKDGSLSKKTLQDFLKRLRFHYSKLNSILRHFCVGEYGDVSFRPHYHCILFNIDIISINHLLNKFNLWPFGFFHVGDVSMHSIQYTAKYTMKKLTDKRDSRLEGRKPEFMICSRKPGIGKSAVEHIFKSIDKSFLSDETKYNQLRFDGKKFPLGRYMVDKLKDMLQDKIDIDVGFDKYFSESARHFFKYFSSRKISTFASFREYFEDVNHDYSHTIENRSKTLKRRPKL
jgi:hypothetical protein